MNELSRRLQYKGLLLRERERKKKRSCCAANGKREKSQVHEANAGWKLEDHRHRNSEDPGVSLDATNHQ